MQCLVCDCDELYPSHTIEFEREDCGQKSIQWYRCIRCGSDSTDENTNQMKEAYYSSTAELDHNILACGSREALRGTMAFNFEWFESYKQMAPEQTFLDIGCNEGAGMDGMQSLGWSVHGFDVNQFAYCGIHVTIADQFRADLFPRRYGAAMAREVIEHVPTWREFLVQAQLSLLPGGLFQLQTPRPLISLDTDLDRAMYRGGHIQLFAPTVLRYWIEQSGFAVLDQVIWRQGQAYMCRAR